jgi:hypothetical protein
VNRHGEAAERRDDLDAAIEVAAGADHGAITGWPGPATHATPSARRIGHVRRVVIAFLAELPDESMTVRELRAELED